MLVRSMRVVAGGRLAISVLAVTLVSGCSGGGTTPTTTTSPAAIPTSSTVPVVMDPTPKPATKPSSTAGPTGSDLGDRVSCASATTGSIDHAAGAQGHKGSVVAAAAEQVKGLRSTDRVELVGNSVADTQTVRVVRDGMIAAVGIYTSDGQGGWLISTTMICAGTGLSWRD